MLRPADQTVFSIKQISRREVTDFLEKALEVHGREPDAPINT